MCDALVEERVEGLDVEIIVGPYFCDGDGLFGKTEEEESVVDQVLACTVFVEAFARIGEDIRELLLDAEVFVRENWTEGADGTLESPDDYVYANSCGETWLRPVAGSKIGTHVFLGGAHAGTGGETWSMESAAEAGKRAAIAILENQGKNAAAASIFIDKHERHPIRFVMFLGGIGMIMILMVLNLFW